MTRKLTTLLLIALMLTVPLRAMAGVGMVCPADEHAAMPMQDGMPGMHCHDMQHDPDESQPPHQQHAPGGCNLCADCCMGAHSLPISFQFDFADRPHSTPIPLIHRAYTGFQPEGPERPPRSSAL